MLIHVTKEAIIMNKTNATDSNTSSTRRTIHSIPLKVTSMIYNQNSSTITNHNTTATNNNKQQQRDDDDYGEEEEEVKKYNEQERQGP